MCNMEKTEVKVQLTEQEIYLCFKHGTSRRTGPLLLWVETVCLLLFAVFSVGAFIMDPAETSSLFFAAVAVVLIAVLWIVPEKRFRAMARNAAEEKLSVTVSVSDTGISFGGTEEYTYDRLTCMRLEQMRVLLFSDQIVGLPDRAFPQKVLDLWQEKLPDHRR